MEEKEISVTIVGFTEDDMAPASCMSYDKNVTIGLKFTKGNQTQILGFSDGDYKLFQNLVSKMSLDEIKKIRNKDGAI